MSHYLRVLMFFSPLSLVGGKNVKLDEVVKNVLVPSSYPSFFLEFGARGGGFCVLTSRNFTKRSDRFAVSSYTRAYKDCRSLTYCSKRSISSLMRAISCTMLPFGLSLGIHAPCSSSPGSPPLIFPRLDKTGKTPAKKIENRLAQFNNDNE
jgi:hypothetical protein